MPGFRVYMFGSSPFPVPAAEVERGMSCILFIWSLFGLFFKPILHTLPLPRYQGLSF